MPGTGIGVGFSAIYITEDTLVPPPIYTMRISRKSAVSVYPNPGTNSFIVSANENIQSLSISNMLGQMVISAQYDGNKQAEVNVSALPCGVYTLRVNDKWVEKMIKK